jgi:hypothetical protein
MFLKSPIGPKACLVATITAPPLASIGDCEFGSAPAFLEQAWSNTVKDYRASIEKLRKDAAEAALVRDLATDKAKRDMYDRLHRHFNGLADEVEKAAKSSAAG